MFSVGFAEFERVLSDGGSYTAAGEAHGSLCGALCAMAIYRVQDWVGELLPNGPQAAESSAEVFDLLFSETAQALGGLGMEFSPLLPDDDAPLSERAASLGGWCQGFLYGIGAGKLASITELPGELPEIIRDFTEISRAAVDDGDPDETNEQAYVELVEFVRVSAQLVFDELAPMREDALARLEALH
jgi:uncharacterized protein YgfB (UPF0149 family)